MLILCLAYFSTTVKQRVLPLMKLGVGGKRYPPPPEMGSADPAIA